MNTNTYLAALHGHSYYSDGQNTPEQLVAQAQKHQITYLALTDHDTYHGLERLYQATQNTSIIPIAGIELMTDQGEVILLNPKPYHQLKPALSWLNQIVDTSPELTATVIKAIDQYDMLVIFPHPNLKMLGMHSITTHKITKLHNQLTTQQQRHIGIEIHNWATKFFLYLNHQREKQLNPLAQQLDLCPVYGADFHSVWGLNTQLTKVNHPSTPSYTGFKHAFKNRQFGMDHPTPLTLRNFGYLTLDMVAALTNDLCKTLHLRPDPNH